MTVDETKATPSDKSDLAAGPLPAATRQRLQKLFEHATRNSQKNDFDYAHDLFTQCVVGDPASIIYLQSLLDNLKRKFNNNKKGGKLAGFKTSAARKRLKSAQGKKDWQAVIRAGCDVLQHSPWDTPTLSTMAEACEQMEIDECQLYYLKWAMNAAPKNPQINRQAAQTLTRMGQFDQAIACWHRVEETKPGDEEAAQAISRLTVEKAVHHGGYSRELLQAKEGKEGAATGSSAKPAPKQDAAPADSPSPQKSREQFLRAKVDEDPSNTRHYFELAKLYEEQLDFQRAEEVLEKATAATGGGDLAVRERLEDVQMRRGRHHLRIAQKRATSDASDEAADLVRRLKSQLNQRELEIFAARVDRDPKNLKLKCELGRRLKVAGKFRHAIEVLEPARKDKGAEADALPEIGECYQHLEEYDLALSKYTAAVSACGKDSSEAKETRKLALYRAGVLATGLRELDQARDFFAELAEIDDGYRDVKERLDKVERLSHKE